MAKSLAGKRAFITGSFQGIGLGIATSLASEGAAIILHGLADAETIAKAESAVLTAGASKVESHVSDLRDSDATESLIAKILSGGAVDILVNNAGIQHTATIAEMPRSKWNDIIAINLTSFFDTMRLLLPHMKERGYGRVINTASVHGLVASAAKAPYVSAKHGVIGLTKVAALEYASAGSRETGGVTINAICPGWFPSEMTQGMDDESSMNFMRANSPLPRMGELHELDGALLLLASDAASFMIGQHVVVDGGWTAR